MANEKIMIVEDDRILATYLYDTLLEMKYNVFPPISSGEEAIASTLTNRPDLVLMDIGLTGKIDGITAAAKIKETLNVPTIFLTSHTQDKFLQKAKTTMPYGYLVKPVSDRELLATIEMALYKHKIDLQLQESEERFRTQYRHSPIPVSTWKFIGNNFELIDCNHAGELLFDISVSKPIGVKASDFFADYDNVFRDMMFCFEKRHVINSEIMYTPQQIDEQRYFNFTYAFIEPDLIMVFTENITERKQAELTIKNQNIELEELNATKDKFFSIIAHDLRGPFSLLLGYTELLIGDINGFSLSELSEINKSLYDAANKVYKLLENLLEWALMQRGTMSFSPQEYILAEIAKNSIDAIGERAVQKEVSVINTISDSICIYADEKMVNSVFRNLLSNAIKFTPKNGKINIHAKEIENRTVEISISDSGIGMPETLRKKLFKIEEKVGRKGTEGEESSGLGLLLCKEFVEKHAGKIWVESEEGKGTTFYFTIPISEQKTQ